MLEVNGSSKGGVKKCASSPCSVMLLSSAAQAAELAGCEKPFLNVTGGRVAAILSTQALRVLLREPCLSNDAEDRSVWLWVRTLLATENIIETSITERNTIFISRSPRFHTNTYCASVSGRAVITLRFPALRFVKLMGPYGPGHGSGRRIVRN